MEILINNYNPRVDINVQVIKNSIWLILVGGYSLI